MALRGSMVERQRDEMAVIPAKSTGGAKHFTAIDEVCIGQHDAFRARRRARGVKQLDNFIGAALAT